MTLSRAPALDVPTLRCAFDELGGIAGLLAASDAARRSAGLAAEAGIAVFKIAFERWIDDTDQRDLSHHIRESLDELKAVTAGR